MLAFRINAQCSNAGASEMIFVSYLCLVKPRNNKRKIEKKPFENYCFLLLELQAETTRKKA